MNWKGAHHSVLMAGEGQPPASMIAGNHDPFLHAGTCQVERLPRQRGEAEMPTSNQPPRVDQGRRLLGPALGPGATVGVLGTGVPRIVCLWSAAWLKW